MFCEQLTLCRGPFIVKQSNRLPHPLLRHSVYKIKNQFDFKILQINGPEMRLNVLWILFNNVGLSYDVTVIQWKASCHK